MDSLRIPAPAQASYPWPADDLAWWNFLLCLGGGWLLSVGPAFHVQAAALALAACGLFLSSEWLSRLGGRSRGGQVQPVSWSLQGAAFLGLSAGSLAFFLHYSAPGDLTGWATAVTAVACLVALMFILRLEWRPLDGRLLYLTHLIVTLPALMFGFLAWGVGSARAFDLWLMPLAYFPAQALASQYWMEGPDAPASAPSIIAIPVLAGVFLQAGAGHWVSAGFLGVFLLRCLWSLQGRRRQGPIAGFAQMKRLEQERVLWNLALLSVWALS